MDWSDERYIRLYVRDSRNMKLFGWEGRALLWATLRKCDLAGIIEGVTGPDDLALMVEMPVDVVRRALATIQSVDPETILLTPRGLVVPNYIPANEAKLSDRARQRQSRAKRAALAARQQELSLIVTNTTDKGPSQPSRGPRSVASEKQSRGRNVTERDTAVSRPVTKTPESVTPSLAEPSLADQRSMSCEQDERKRVGKKPSEQELKVFRHWQQTHDRGGCSLTAGRLSRIRARLAEKDPVTRETLFTAELLCEAISGARNDPWLMGELPNSTRKYLDIPTLLRDAPQVERLIELNRTGPHRPAARARTRSEAQLEEQVRRAVDLRESDGDVNEAWGLCSGNETKELTDGGS